MPRPQPEEMFRTFERHGVRYVLMGEFAAALHGAELRAASTDCCPARDVANLERLADALNELAATPRREPALADTLWDAGMLSQVDGLDLATRVGDLSIGFVPAGTGGYEDLARLAEPYDLEDLIVPVASLDDLISAASAIPRLHGRDVLPELHRLRALRRRRDRA